MAEELVKTKQLLEQAISQREEALSQLRQEQEARLLAEQRLQDSKAISSVAKQQANNTLSTSWQSGFSTSKYEVRSYEEIIEDMKQEKKRWGTKKKKEATVSDRNDPTYEEATDW